MTAGLLALVALVAGIATAQRCNDNDLKRCVKELEVLTNNKDLAFAHTEKDLVKICGHLQQALSCVNQYTSRCFSASQQDAYNSITSGAQDLLSDLCTNGSAFRQKYLKHAPCYRMLSVEYQHCLDSYLSQQESIKKRQLSSEEQLREFCCLFDVYKSCTRTAISQKCSAEAADLGVQIVDKAGGPLLHSHCSKYKDNDNCPASGVTLSLPTLLMLAAVTILVAFF